MAAVSFTPATTGKWSVSYATSSMPGTTITTNSNAWIKCKYTATNDWDLDTDNCRIVERIPDKLPAGKRTMEMPDGAKLIVDNDGNYRIEDKDAKVTYKANRIREFSPYLNASDMLAKFVADVGGMGVKRDEVMGLPIHLFISWLILEAAQRDGDPVPRDVLPVKCDPLLKLAVKPKCLACGRFIPRLHWKQRFPFCSPEHGARHLARLPKQQKQLARSPLPPR